MDGGDLLLIGSAKGLAALGRLLEEPEESVLALDDSPPRPPFTHAAKRLKVRTEPDSGMTIQPEDGDVAFIGDVKALQILGNNLSRFAEGALGPHLHIEYFPEHFYLRHDAVPLTVELIQENH